MTGGFMAGGRTRFVMVGRHFRGLIAGSVLSDRVMRPMWPSLCGSGKRMTAFFDGTISERRPFAIRIASKPSR
jgi:hypothetical protein